MKRFPLLLLVAATATGAGCGGDTTIGPDDGGPGADAGPMVDGGSTPDGVSDTVDAGGSDTVGGDDSGGMAMDGSSEDASEPDRCTVGETHLLVRTGYPRATQVLVNGDEALVAVNANLFHSIHRSNTGVLAPAIAYPEVGPTSSSSAWSGDELTVVTTGSSEVFEFDPTGLLLRRRDFGQSMSSRNGFRPGLNPTGARLVVAYSRDTSIDVELDGAEVWLGREDDADRFVHERLAITTDSWAHTTELLSGEPPIVAWASWREFGFVTLSTASEPFEYRTRASSNGAVFARAGDRLVVAGNPLVSGSDTFLVSLSLTDGSEHARQEFDGRVAALLMDGDQYHLLVEVRGGLEHRLMSTSLDVLETTMLHAEAAPGRSAMGQLSDGTLLATYGTGRDTTAEDDDAVHLVTIRCDD